MTQHQEHPVSITSARTSHSEDLHKRQVRYLLSMGIRTVCFVLAAVTATNGAPWWVWGLFALLAVVLPYIAVVLANAVRPRLDGRFNPVTPETDPKRQIEP